MVFVALYTVKLNDEIVDKFENRRWNIPATVYSRPLTISGDTALRPADLETWLTLLHYKKGSTEKTGGYIQTGDTFIIHTRGFDYGDGEKDPAQVLKISFHQDRVSGVQSTHKNSIGQVRLEPVNIGGIYPENNEDRILLTKDTIPTPLTDALIATEDRNFYDHHGVSVRGVGRALVSNLRGGSTQGGSTITQQLIKNFYLSSERTLKRKINEALMAILLERHYTKQDILLAYLNEINLGQNGNRSVNGFAVASEFYFNKPLNELSLDQYALLVGIAKGPSYYNPRKHPKRALDRRNTVLHNMLVMGKISQEDHDKSVQEPLNIVKTPAIAKSKFPDFFDVVQRELKKYYKEEDLRNAGLKIISTLDPIAQTAADQAMSTKLKELKKANKFTGNLEGALVSADPATGQLLAIVGSGSEFTGFNRAIDAKRQVGSLLKPVIYLTALQDESGRYNLASSVNDEAISYPSGGKSWTPDNYNHQSHGNVPLMTALANSYNQSAVNVGMEFGLNTFQRQIHQLGVDGNFSSYPSVLLGAVDLSPIEMLGMYQVFANNGKHIRIHSILRVISEKGVVIQRTGDTLTATQRFRPEHIYLINFATSQVIKEGTGRPALSLGEELNLVGKTGTTNDARDAWFAGFSGNYVSVVWVGRDDNKPIGLTGGTGALPIWIDYMKRLTLTPVSSAKPAKIEWVWLENGTGKLTKEYCTNAVHVPVLLDAMPKEYSDCHVMPTAPTTNHYPNDDYSPPVLPTPQNDISDTGDDDFDDTGMTIANDDDTDHADDDGNIDDGGDDLDDN